MFLPDTPRPASRLVAVDATGGECHQANGTILARPGDVVTCPEGHPVWQVVEPIRAGESPRSAALRSAGNGAKPLKGVAQPCPQCGRGLFARVTPPSTYGIYLGGRLAGGEGKCVSTSPR